MYSHVYSMVKDACGKQQIEIYFSIVTYIQIIGFQT